MLPRQDCLLLTFSASDAAVLVSFPAAIFTLLLSHSEVIHSQLCCLRNLSDIHLLLKTCLVRVFQHTGCYFVVITEPLSHISLSFDLIGSSVAARLFRPRDSPGKNTGVDRHSLLQGIFLPQGLNSSLLNWYTVFCFWFFC